MKKQILKISKKVFCFFKTNFLVLLFLIFLLQISAAYIFYYVYYANVKTEMVDSSADILLNQKLIDQFQGALQTRQDNFKQALSLGYLNPFEQTATPLEQIATSSDVD